MSLVENVIGIISNKDNKEFEISLYNSLSDISTPKALEIKHKNNTIIIIFFIKYTPSFILNRSSSYVNGKYKYSERIQHV